MEHSDATVALNHADIVEVGAAPRPDGTLHLYRMDWTGLPGGDPKTRLFEKHERFLNACGF